MAAVGMEKAQKAAARAEGARGVQKAAARGEEARKEEQTVEKKAEGMGAPAGTVDNI